MNENNRFDLTNLMVYLTHFHEDTTFNQNVIVCMADRSTADSKPLKFPRSKLPTYKPRARSHVPEKSRLPRTSILHSDGSKLPIASTSTTRISSTIKPVERNPDAGRRSKLVPPKVTWHSILSSAEYETLSSPSVKSTSMPTSRETIGSTPESSEIPQLDEVGKIYMSMSMYLNSDSLRKTLMDEVSDLFKPSLPEETTPTIANKDSHRSPSKLSDERTKNGIANTDSVEATSVSSGHPFMSAPYDIEKLRDKWYKDYKRKRRAARKPPSSLQPMHEIDETLIGHNSPRKKTQPQHSRKQTKPELPSSIPPNISAVQYHIDRLSKYLDSNSHRRTLMDQINDIFYSPPEETTTTIETTRSQSKLTDQRTKKEIVANMDSVENTNAHSRPSIISAPYDIEKARVKWIEDYKRKRQAARKKPSSLQPIQEETQETSIDQDFDNKERQVKKALEYEEELLRKRIEDELPDGLIYDTNMSILVPSTSSSSKESFEIDLVVKAPPMREPITDYDDDINLSIPEQAKSESNKLTEQIEAIKDKYHIYVARKKYKQSLKPRRSPDIRQEITTKPTSSSIHVPIRNPFHDALEKKLRSEEIAFVPRNVRSPTKTSIPLNLMDKHTWGAVALPKPISPHRDYSDSSSDLDILTDKEMNTDGAFEPMKLKTSSQRRQELIDWTLFEDINDFEDPQFTNLTWDESIKESSELPKIMDFHGTENINDLEDPQFSDLPSDDSIHHIYKEPDIEPTLPHSPASSDRSTDPLEDMKRIKEFIMSGRQLKDVKDQSIIDLFMRCSESLINPVVRLEILERQEGTDELRPVIHEIPLSTFTHGRSYERGLLDESIHENNLDEPLIKKPSKKIPNYFADFDALHDPRFAKVDLSVGEDDEDARYKLIFGLPKFSYEPVPQYLYRKKVHDIMDSEEEPEDSDDILEDDDMNIDSLIKDVAAPTYTFQSEPNYIEESRAREKYYRNLIEKYRAARQSDLQITTVPESEHLNDPVEVNQSRETRDSTNHEILKHIFAQSYINVNEMVDGTSVESILIPYFFDYPIIREVDNCQYHMKIVNIIYRKYEFFFGPSNEEDSPTEMHAKFNQIRNGRICARLKSCPPGLPSLSPRASVPSQSGSSKTPATTTSSGTERSTRTVIRKYLERKIAEDLAVEAEEAARRKVLEADENTKRKLAEATEKDASLNVEIAMAEEQIEQIDKTPIDDQESVKLAKKIKKIVSWGDDDSTCKTPKVSRVTKKFKLEPTAETKTPASRSATVKTTIVKTSQPVNMRPGVESSGVASSGHGTAGAISCRKTVIMSTTSKTTTAASPHNKLNTKRK